MDIPDYGDQFISIGSGLRYKRMIRKDEEKLFGYKLMFIEKKLHIKSGTEGWFIGECLDLEGVGYFHPSLSRGWKFQ